MAREAGRQVSLGCHPQPPFRTEAWHLSVLACLLCVANATAELSVLILRQCGMARCRCPLDGLKEAFRNCRRAYRAQKAAANFSFYIAPAGHEVTQDMDARVESFFQEHLLPKNPSNSTGIQAGQPL